MVAGHHFTRLIHRETPVGVAVISKACVQSLFKDKFLQRFDMGGTDTVVDVDAIRFSPHHIGLCAQCVKDRFRNIPGASVRTVKSDLQPLEGIQPQRDQITDIPVTSRHIVDRPSRTANGTSSHFCPNSSNFPSR